MFGIDGPDIARGIRSSINDVLDGFRSRAPRDPWTDLISTSYKPVVDPRVAMSPDGVIATRSVVDPRLSSRGGARPLAAAAPAPFQANATPSLPVASGGGDTATMRAQALALARAMFGAEGERQLNTTFEVEGGWNPATVGDRNLSPVGSHGPLQFYGGGGQLNNFAGAKGIADLSEAGRYVREHPVEAVQWALNNYYGNALRSGMDQGLRGSDLATFIQKNGQRSVSPERAGDAYRRLYGG